jgi:hydroxymethylpyrimidine pyrophosphatase-like HAD family hydrolase
MKVSFDFDGTLEYSPVMDYARELVLKKVKVYIVTARHHQFYSDVLEVAEGLKIPYRRIIFTGGDEKFPFFKDNKDFKFHLDDDLTTTRLINERTPVKGVAYWANPDWKIECNNELNK